MRIDYDDNLSVDWTDKELATIKAIKARKARGRMLGGKWDRKQRYLRDLWYYHDLFYHPEISVAQKMKWEAQG